MGRIQDVNIHQFDIRADLVEPFYVALLDVLAPEINAFEELGAFGDFAAVLVDIFLLNELRDLLAARYGMV